MNRIRQYPITSYFTLAFLFSWLIAIVMIARHNDIVDIPGWLHYFAAWGPALATLVVTGMSEGHKGIIRLMGRLLYWRVGRYGWLLAVGSPLVMLAVAILVSRVINGTTPDLARLGEVDYLGSIGIPAALMVWIFSFGIGEEIGWRGFAQHHLEPRHGLLYSAVIIGFIWACWHLPYFFYRDTFIEMGLIGFPLYVVNIVPGAIVLAWIYSQTRSILTVGLWHGCFDFATASAIDEGTVPMVMSVLVILWAIWIVRQVRRASSASYMNEYERLSSC